MSRHIGDGFPQINRWGRALHCDGNSKTNGEFDMHGHLMPLPRIGDTFTFRFQKGNVRMSFTKIRPTGDPPDMFFATAEGLYYLHDRTRRPGR